MGDLVEDIVVWVTQQPQRGTDTPARVFRRRGGSAANVAVLAIQAGGSSRFIGQVGDDQLGTALVAEMTSAGVDVAGARGGRTGTVVVLVEPNGERTMLPDRAAATRLAQIPANALDGVDWLHVPAYSLIVQPLGRTSGHLIEQAHEGDIGVSIDASSIGLIDAYGTEPFAALVSGLRPDVLFCNQDEARLLGVGSGSPFSGASLTVVKAGADPVLLIDPGGRTIEVPVPPVDDVADTTGAGDAFAAGFLVATMGGAPPEQAALAGNRLAATVLRRPGANTEDL